jgi:hypothetical protein
LIWGALSDERTGLSFTIPAGLASGVILGSESCGTCDHILQTLMMGTEMFLETSVILIQLTWPIVREDFIKETLIVSLCVCISDFVQGYHIEGKPEYFTLFNFFH